jgi:hypothetical protein
VAKVWFEYRLVPHGWAEARFELDDAVADLTASYLGDALGDQLVGPRRLRAYPGTVRVSWIEEPGEDRWGSSDKGQLADIGALMRGHMLWLQP